MARLTSTDSAAVRRGRAAGSAALVALVTAFTAVCAIQILQQAWAGGRAPAGLRCHDGMRGLIAAIHRAREAAAAVTEGERVAVARFRQALEPEWSARAGLTERCAEDASALPALGDLDRLRYAEEHAIRYESHDVAGRRRRVDELERALQRPDAKNPRAAPKTP